MYNDDIDSITEGTAMGLDFRSNDTDPIWTKDRSVLIQMFDRLMFVYTDWSEDKVCRYRHVQPLRRRRDCQKLTYLPDGLYTLWGPRFPNSSMCFLVANGDVVRCVSDQPTVAVWRHAILKSSEALDKSATWQKRAKWLKTNCGDELNEKGLITHLAHASYGADNPPSLRRKKPK